MCVPVRCEPRGRLAEGPEGVGCQEQELCELWLAAFSLAEAYKWSSGLTGNESRAECGAVSLMYGTICSLRWV